MTTLYELTGQYLQLNEESDMAQLNELKDTIENKVENIGKLILSLKSESEDIDEEIARLVMRRNARDNQMTSLKQYLLQEMTLMNIDKIKRTLFTVSVRINPPSVNVLNKEDVPVHFRRIIPETWEVDKRTIIENFKANGEIPNGCEVIYDKKSLQIR